MFVFAQAHCGSTRGRLSVVLAVCKFRALFVVSKQYFYLN